MRRANANVLADQGDLTRAYWKARVDALQAAPGRYDRASDQTFQLLDQGRNEGANPSDPRRCREAERYERYMAERERDES